MVVVTKQPIMLKRAICPPVQKDWSHSQLFPLALIITASISLGEKNFPSLRSLTFRINIYAMYFRLPAVWHLINPTFAENDNLITMDIVLQLTFICVSIKTATV